MRTREMACTAAAPARGVPARAEAGRSVDTTWAAALPPPPPSEPDSWIKIFPSCERNSSEKREARAKSEAKAGIG